jgi:putative NIF3 family GTP cyclohydrolase 1 type 2
MRVEAILKSINDLFETTDNPHYEEECGLTYDAGREVKKIGYATNLTIEVIEQAKDKKIDLIITHHDSWHFIGDLDQKCKALLKEYQISHYFNHLPLDDANFGTNAELSRLLGLKEVKRVNDENGFLCGIISEYDNPITFEAFRARLEDLTGEKVQAWKFNNDLVSKVHIICGAGFMTTDMKVGVDEGCNLFLTGERILYTIEYAKLVNLNLVIGSHTFTELFGVKGMIDSLNLENVEVLLIEEEHLEAQVLS